MYRRPRLAPGDRGRGTGGRPGLDSHLPTEGMTSPSQDRSLNQAAPLRHRRVLSPRRRDHLAGACRAPARAASITCGSARLRRAPPRCPRRPQRRSCDGALAHTATVRRRARCACRATTIYGWHHHTRSTAHAAHARTLAGSHGSSTRPLTPTPRGAPTLHWTRRCRLGRQPAGRRTARPRRARPHARSAREGAAPPAARRRAHHHPPPTATLALHPPPPPATAAPAHRRAPHAQKRRAARDAPSPHPPARTPPRTPRTPTPPPAHATPRTYPRLPPNQQLHARRSRPADRSPPRPAPPHS